MKLNLSVGLCSRLEEYCYTNNIDYNTITSIMICLDGLVVSIKPNSYINEYTKYIEYSKLKIKL